jgi:hypothetical protein
MPVKGGGETFWKKVSPPHPFFKNFMDKKAGLIRNGSILFSIWFKFLKEGARGGKLLSRSFPPRI